jgi:hypothetical protein
MSDDADDELPEVECELDPRDGDSLADWHEFSGAGSSQSGVLIFAGGVDAFVEKTGALLIRVADRGGDVEILTELGRPWRQVDKPSGGLAAVPRKDK